MAYNIHYRIAYKRLSNSTTTIDILENGYGGSVVNLNPDAAPLQISKSGDVSKIFQSTIGSGAVININGTPLSMLNLFSADPQQFIVKCYNGSSGTGLFWQGFVNTEIYNEDYSANYPIPISINANDGMTVLDSLWYKQSNGAFYTGCTTIGTVINNILGKLGITFSNVYTSNDISTNGTNYNLFNNITVNQDNYIDESRVAMTCREVLDSIFQGLGLVLTFQADSIFIIDPINLNDTTKGKKYTLSSFTESTNALGGYIDLSGGTLTYYETGQALDIVPKVDEVDIKYDPYTFINYKYDFNDVKNLASVGSWGHITSPSEWYNNSTVQFSGWTQSTSGHFVGAKETNISDPTYMLWLTGTDVNNEPILKLTGITANLYKDNRLSVKISLDCWFQTKENNWNIFAPNGGNQVYGYYVQTSLKVGNQYFNGSSWTTGFTHNLIAVKSCTSAQFGANPANSTANDTWITASTILPLDSSLVGSNNIVFCIYDYWSGSQGITQRKNFSPVIGILLKNLNISIITTSTGKEIDNSGVLKRGNISTNTIYKTNVTNIKTTSGTGVYSVSNGAFRDTSYAPIAGLYRGGNYTTEQLVLQSYLSQYKVPRLKLSANFNVKNYMLDIWMKLIKDNKYLSGKGFYIVGSTYDDETESMQCEMIEITNSRDSIT
jgi:hypothetical protein